MRRWAGAEIILSDPRAPDAMLFLGLAGNPFPNGIKFASSNIEQGARGDTLYTHEFWHQAVAVDFNWQNKFHPPSGYLMIFTLSISTYMCEHVAFFIVCK